MATTTNNGQPNFDTYVKESDLEKDGVSNILTSTTGTVHHVRLVNGANITHFKMYDAYSITYGTTDPCFVVPVAADTTMSVQCRQGITFSTAATMAAARAGGTGSGGDTQPSLLAVTIFGGA
tara:strand:- start:385 stop:750 length:366 start_codon:yes stop_codon:yes gene_type:complete